jgi:asparagine synthase (glutamine-hydrolysing)
MCGIAGYWGFEARDLTGVSFAAFTHSLAHRGPDAFAIKHYADARLWLGHRRLAIIDLSDHGRQPLSYANGRYWITYNGEVYNYSELRAELEALGHQFASTTDTEVIVAAYAQWGPECQLRFNGMWGFAIWDSQERQLFLSRDRFGIKPLYYTFHNGAIAFASELKAFLALPWIDGAFDGEILSETLTNLNGLESTGYSLLSNVLSLRAGHAMLVTPDGRVRITRWWNTLDHLRIVPTRFDQQVDEFREIFFDACRVRLRSDVPLGTSLSGGLDSSAIACTVSKLNRSSKTVGSPRDWRRAFVISWKGTPYDEENYARAIIRHADMTAHLQCVEEATAVNNLEKIIFDVESIYSDPKVGHWVLYRAMRANGIYVSLDGSGADELLGGYPNCVAAAIDATLNLSRYFDLRRTLRGFGEEDRGSIFGGLQSLLKFEMTRLHLLEPIRAVRARVQEVSMHLRRLFGADNFSFSEESEQQTLHAYRGVRRLYDERLDSETREMTPLQAMLFSWFHKGMLPTLLRNFDRASMAHGVETRMPFMDWRLVIYSFALPETSKIGGGFTKRILRQAMEGIMPDSIRLRRNKFGFVSPFTTWSGGLFNCWLRDACASQSFLESPVWNGRRVQSLVNQAVVAERSIEAVWPIIQAHVLEQSFKTQALLWKKLAHSGRVRSAAEHGA